MLYLLDINVLIARTDERHEHHQRCVDWDRQNGFPGLATCPITENGFLRIYGHPNYPNGPGSPRSALSELNEIRRLSRHVFIGDSISIADNSCFSNLDNLTPKQLTDVYLLALAVRHGCRFVTLDKSIPSECVSEGQDALVSIL